MEIQHDGMPTTDHECAWCGAESDRLLPNRHGELFCTRSHREASNRARKRLEAVESRVEETDLMPIRKLPVIQTRPAKGFPGGAVLLVYPPSDSSNPSPEKNRTVLVTREPLQPIKGTD